MTCIRADNMKNEIQRISLKLVIYTLLYDSNTDAPSNPSYRYNLSCNGAAYFTKFTWKFKGHDGLYKVSFFEILSELTSLFWFLSTTGTN